MTLTSLLACVWVLEPVISSVAGGVAVGPAVSMQEEQKQD